VSRIVLTREVVGGNANQYTRSGAKKCRQGGWSPGGKAEGKWGWVSTESATRSITTRSNRSDTFILRREPLMESE